MSVESMNRNLQLSIDLVKAWGQAKLPNGKTFGQMLTYDAVSFWDLMSIHVALYYVPEALSPFRKKQPHVLSLTKTYLSACKQHLMNKKNIYLCAGKVPQKSLKPVFLFLGFQPYFYKDTIQPVVQSMVDDKKIDSVSLGENLSGQSFDERSDQRSEVQSIWQYWNKDVQDYADSVMSSFKKAIKELKVMNILPKIIEHQGQTLWPQLENAFDELFIFCLPYFVKRYAIAKHVLEHHRPAVIISSDVADPRTQMYCLLGRRLHIPTLEVQFGAYGPDSVEWQFALADRIAAWGETSRDTFLAHGVEQEKIVLAGSPRHDSMVSIDQNEVAQTRAMLGIPKEKAMILFASCYSSIYDQIEWPDLVDSVKRAIFQSVGQNKDVCLVVKPHPLEKEKLTKKISGKQANIIFADKNDDIKRLIRACDVFISLGTTATLDALIAHKLVICPNFPGWIWSDLFVNSQAVLAPRSKEELTQAIQNTGDGERQKVLADLEPARKHFLQKWIYQLDGQAAMRISALAKQMAG